MEPIRQDIDPVFRAKYLRHMRIGRVLHARPLLRRVVLRLADACQSIAEDYRNHLEDLDFRERIRPSEDVSVHGITDPFGDLSPLLKYASEIHSDAFGDAMTESRILYDRQLAVMRKVLSRGGGVPTVLNLGVSYAHVDSILAREFPGTEFCGIDLSPYTKAINEAAFAGIPNLKFFNGDVFDLLEQVDFNGAVLFHSRTLVQLPRSFIERLYATCLEKGFSHLVGFEQFGFSRETRAPFVFDETDRPSVHWRNKFYIHNTPGLAVAAGFAVEEASVLKVPRESADFRPFCFTAHRPG